MMETKFTPGPWVATERRGFHEILAPCSECDWYGREKMHAVAYCDTEIVEVEQIANAHLIAAAPALYAALEECVKQMDWSSEAGRDAHAAASVALALARGAA